MKKIYILLMTSFFLFSCSNEFLTTSPDHENTEGNFFKNKAHFEQALNGTYRTLHNIVNRSAYIMGEMRSDNTHYTYYSADRGRYLIFREDIANFLVDEQNEIVGDIWRDLYLGVSRANTILDRIETINFDGKNQIIAEARFLRAYFYFQLVRYFGPVPLQLHEVKKAEDAFIGQSTIDEVYSVIEEDVCYAIDELAVEKNFPSSGRASKGAAQMLYAYVLMTRPNRDYKESEKQLKDVIGMPYGLLENYEDVYKLEYKNSKEHIFSVQYMKGDYGISSQWLYHFIPKSKDPILITGVPYGDNLLQGGWNVPTQKMIDSYELNDKRLNASIAVAVGQSENGEVLSFENVLKPKDPAIADYDYAIPFIAKYWNPHLKAFETDDNWPIYRYADALLLLAENLVEQGKNEEAKTYLNQVRVRAGLDPLFKVNKEDVAHERKVELAFENHRWFDLVRTGKAIEVIKEHGDYIKSIDIHVSEKAYKITSDDYLFPIPYRERNINQKLKQNPGY